MRGCVGSLVNSGNRAGGTREAEPAAFLGFPFYLSLLLGVSPARRAVITRSCGAAEGRGAVGEGGVEGPLLWAQ